ncbi:hypothetical protein [Clostridium botulinum]|uniref:hypothetical protein n=1 Tax=Clostridium botulinum TaxID=1491 RepID=UPI00095798D9|nr:hypothetical protein [Clostridium botulinum]APU61175.1 hypothetical protein NPD8_3134 [Clostridium botulinum]BDB02114.1 hypothetical protein CBOS2020_21880 [Clostridium botulinum]
MKKWYNCRPAYNETEISKNIKEKLKRENMSLQKFYEEYSSKYKSFNKEILDMMLSGKTYYNTLMFEIASDFLKIEFEELTRIIEDNEEVDYRSFGNEDKDTKQFCEIVNILFSEMIENKNLNK